MSFFGKQENQKQLQYDDVAFLHFFTSIAIVCILAIVGSIIYTCLKVYKSKNKYNRLSQQTLLFRKQINNQEKRKENKLLDISMFIKIILLIALCILVFFCVSIIQDQQTRMISFDPYEILSVDPTSTISQIKKSYRKLALQYHPDRNKNNPQASAKFIIISKAYQCLTEEDKKQNCLKFGNPDGDGAFEVGIGLPSIVINPSNQIIVLPFALIVLLVIVPGVFLYWNNHLQAQDTVTNLLISDIPTLYKFFSQEMTSDIFILMLSSLKQLNNQVKMPQQAEIKILISKIVQLKIINPLNLDLIPKPFLKTTLKVLQHIKGIKYDALIAKTIEDNIGKILRLTLLFCRKINQDKSLVNEKYPLQFLGVDKFRLFLQFQRKLYNGLYQGPISCALQLLDLNDKQIDLIRSTPPKYSMLQIIKSTESKTKFLQQFFIPQRRKFIQQQIQNISLIDMQIKVTLDDEQTNTIKTKDRALIKYTIKKMNKTTGYCHLSKYHFMKEEKFYFLFIYENNLIAFKQIQFNGKDSFEGEFPYIQAFPKKVNFVAKVVSDVYYGIDVQKEVTINVVVQEEIKKDSNIHPQDMSIQRMPKGILESVLTLDFGPDSDRQLSDGEDDDQPTIKTFKRIRINPQCTMSLQQKTN